MARVSRLQSISPSHSGFGSGRGNAHEIQFCSTACAAERLTWDSTKYDRTFEVIPPGLLLGEVSDSSL